MVAYTFAGVQSSNITGSYVTLEDCAAKRSNSRLLRGFWDFIEGGAEQLTDRNLQIRAAFPANALTNLGALSRFAAFYRWPGARDVVYLQAVTIDSARRVLLRDAFEL